jgi:hypothetical protein
MASRWITNLESAELCQAKVDAAQAALSAARTGDEIRAAKAQLETAKFIQADVRNTLQKIKNQHGQVDISDPHPTPERTADEIKAQGIIGIYKPGAGNSYGETVTIGG